MKIYYSRSNEVMDSNINPHLIALTNIISQELGGCPITLTKHSRGKDYNPQLVTDADIVIVGTTELDPNNGIAKGCYTEIMLAYKHDIPVFAFVEEDEGLVFLHQVLGDPDRTDISIENEKCWQIGHAELNLYGDFSDVEESKLRIACDFHDIYSVRSFLTETFGMRRVKVWLSIGKAVTNDNSDSFFEQVFELENGVGKTGTPQWKEKPRKNMLLVRRRMRR